ncbi:MAG: ABC transporter ATP-binding protein [Gammaproteobacteria bacterium]|nr:ABC transporter ATP-binding protein [Gammaproteobacteria bacterium]
MAAVLEIENLSVVFRRAAGDVEAVRDVSLRVGAGECVGIVGESGSGKTQLCVATMGLLPANAAAGGSVRFAGLELLSAPVERLNEVRGSRLAMIFQDPQSALTPHLKIGVQMAEVLVCHRRLGWRAARQAALQMLARVGLPDPARCLDDYPHQLSGGMRQRVVIGMSLLCGPDLVIADEPTTALDAGVQAQVLELLGRLRRESGMGILLISHDLAVVSGLAERIVVMYAGRIVETAACRELFRAPRHPYTAALMRCSPTIEGPVALRLATLAGQPPAAGQAAAGCAFAPRCGHATLRCVRERPQLEATGAGGAVACHHPLNG